MREDIFEFRKAVPAFKNKSVLDDKKYFDITACCGLRDIGFAFLKFYIESTEWIYGSTFNKETANRGV